MNSIIKIKNRIASLLQKEIERSNAEIEELQQKQHDNMASYGIGGPYNRYEKAIARRRTHLKELESILPHGVRRKNNNYQSRLLYRRL